MLEDEPFVVGREIRFGILSAEGDLPHVAQVTPFAGHKHVINARRRTKQSCCNKQQQRDPKPRTPALAHSFSYHLGGHVILQAAICFAGSPRAAYDGRRTILAADTYALRD